MKRFFFSSGLGIAITALCLLIPFSSQAQIAGAIDVEFASICTGVADREAVVAGTSFAVSVGQLY